MEIGVVVDIKKKKRKTRMFAYFARAVGLGDVGVSLFDRVDSQWYIEKSDVV